MCTDTQYALFLLVLQAYLTKVAYGGEFPSVDWDGNELSPARKALAGTRIAGGPYCLTEVRHPK